LGVDGPERIGEAYPAGTYERLVAVKQQYDPANLFRSNHNIVP
jgi:FAD/FMN-containing dehydrogenase